MLMRSSSGRFASPSATRAKVGVTALPPAPKSFSPGKSRASQTPTCAKTAGARTKVVRPTVAATRVWDELRIAQLPSAERQAGHHAVTRSTGKSDEGESENTVAQ